MTSNTPVIAISFIAFLVMVVRFYFAKDYRANMNPVLHVLTWVIVIAGFAFEIWFTVNHALPHR